ncbi:hypothetical protein HDU98_000004 [Podochytrium sp. JEL0797]|nr:hypothetical protein HDU98_000004 [Podochytrium sp. JEL0797]
MKATLFTLPSELHLQIFLLLAVGQQGTSLAVLKHLSLVCRAWRRLAQSSVLVPAIRGGKSDEVVRMARQAKGALRTLSVGHVLAAPVLKQVSAMCPGITHLNISKAEMTSTGLVFLLHRLPMLTHVDFSGVESVTDISLAILARQSATRLVSLNISHCTRVTANGLEHVLTRCVNLKSFKTGLADELLPLVSKLTSLVTLDMAYSSQVTTRALQQTFLGQTATTHCTCLVPPIVDYVKPQDYNLPAPPLKFTPFLPNIATLNLADCLLSVTDDLLTILGWSTPNLSSISLKNCHLVTDLGVSRLAEGCSMLSYINLDGCLEITDISLDALGVCCGRTLTSATFSKCTQVSDEGVQELVGQCSVLRVLVLDEVVLLSDAVLGYLQMDPCPTLQFVSLNNCPSISTRAISQVHARVNAVLPQMKRRLSISSISSSFSGSSSGGVVAAGRVSRRTVALVVKARKDSGGFFAGIGVWGGEEVGGVEERLWE